MGLRKRKLKAVIISIFAFVAAIGISFGYALADRDVATLLDEWFNKKVMIAQSKIDSAIQTEKEVQMARVEDTINKIMGEADRKLEEYTAAEIETRTSAIREHADYLISNLHITIDDDKAQISSKLDLIMGDVLGAMDQLSDSYVPPTPVYEKKEPVLPPKEIEPEDKDQNPISDQPESDETSDLLEPEELEADQKPIDDTEQDSIDSLHPKLDQPESNEPPDLLEAEELEADQVQIDDTEQNSLDSQQNIDKPVDDELDVEVLDVESPVKQDAKPHDKLIDETDEVIVNPDVSDDLDIEEDEPIDAEIQAPVQLLNPMEEVVEKAVVDEQPVSEIVTEHPNSVEEVNEVFEDSVVNGATENQIVVNIIPINYAVQDPN